MGNRGRHIYQQSVLAGQPTLWAGTPASVLASDYGETLVNAILAGVGGSLLSAWLQQAASHSVDVNTSMAWGAGAAGIVLLAPVAGDMLADALTDIRIGWERGKPSEPESPAPKPEPIRAQR